MRLTRPQAEIGAVGARGCGGVAPERAVRALAVVVVDEHLQHALEVALPADQQPVEALAANGAHEALRMCVGLGRPKGRQDDPDSVAAEDFVEGAAELGVAVMDQETRVAESAREAQIARLLRDPVRARCGAAACELDPARLKLDEKRT